MWGKYIEAELEKVRDNNHKKKNVGQLVDKRLRAILHPLDLEKVKAGTEKPKPVPKGKFADPAASVIKKRS